MTKISDIPRDLTEEVLSKLPLTSLRRVRSTCKNGTIYSKVRSFVKKHLAGQAKVAETQRGYMVVMLMDFRVYLMSVNLDNNVESCIKRQGKLCSLDDEVDYVNQIFHCDGLLLCITKDYSLVVWIPYWGKIQRIQLHNFSYPLWDSYSYALGFDKSSKSYKILKFTCYHDHDSINTFITLDIYYFNFDSWRIFHFTSQDWDIFYSDYGVSLKRNMYWFAREKCRETRETYGNLLVCFDFTSERFGPALPVPFEFDESPETNFSMSSVREEQLVVLYQPLSTLKMEIWVTTKI